METLRIDPLKKLGFEEVIRRTGYSRRLIHKMLAEDEKNETPGKHFPKPIRRPGTNRLEWRELTLVKWFEEQEGERP